MMRPGARLALVVAALIGWLACVRHLERVLYRGDCRVAGVEVTGARCDDVGPELALGLGAWRTATGLGCELEGLRVYMEPNRRNPPARATYSMGVIRIYDVELWRPLLRHELAHHCATQAGWPGREQHDRFRELGID